MTDIHAIPVVDDKFWIIKQGSMKIATLHKQENNRFMLTNRDHEMWFNRKEEITNFFGEDFFITVDKIKSNNNLNECHGFLTRTLPFNSMYDVKRKLPLYTKNSHSKSYYCAGWYIVKFTNWVISYCPKLITVDRYDSHGPFKSKEEASAFKCNIK